MRIEIDDLEAYHAELARQEKERQNRNVQAKEEVDRLINDLLQTPEFCTALAMITYNDRDPLNLTYRIFGPLPRWGRAIANILPALWRP